jgi:hypothetical protein
VKLVSQQDDSFTFLIGKRERDMLAAVLLRYPVLSSGHFSKRHPANENSLPDEALLDEALREQQKESRKNLELWLTKEGRFQETDLGCTFQLTSGELEWMLQILNDVRVGSWVLLGEPDGKTPAPAELTEDSMQIVWALEVAGLFQHYLLRAAQGTE